MSQGGGRARKQTTRMVDEVPSSDDEAPRSRRGKRRGRDESSEEKGRGKKRGRGGRVDYVEESSNEESEESEEEEYDEDDLFAAAQVQLHCFRTHLFEPAARGHCGTTERAMGGTVTRRLATGSCSARCLTQRWKSTR